MTKTYLSARHVAEICNVHPATVRQRRGAFAKLTRYRLGTLVRYDRAEVEALVKPIVKLPSLHHAHVGRLDHRAIAEEAVRSAEQKRIDRLAKRLAHQGAARAQAGHSEHLRLIDRRQRERIK